MNREIGITIREALELGPLKNARLVAGEGGLKRVVKSVNIMEVPDISQWVKEGELLLTTVYAIRDDAEAQRNLIPALAERGLAGIAIKPGRYIEEIPTVMLEQAEEYNFPLIELPFHSSFSDIMEPVLSEILNVQAVFLQKSLDTHEILMNVVLNGGGLCDIVISLARIVQNPVAIVNQNFEVRAYDFLEGLNETDLFEYDGLARVWRLKAEYVRYKERVGRFQWLTIELNGRELRQISIPIFTGSETYGYIFAWEALKKIEASDLLSIERSITVAAVEILNEQALFEVEQRYRNELLHDLLNGRFESEEVILARAKAMHWDLSKPMGIIIFESVSVEQNEDQRWEHMALNRIIQGIRQLITSHKEELILGEWGNRLVLLHPVPEGIFVLGEEEVGRFIEKTVGIVVKFIDQYQRKCFVGMGSFRRGIRNLETGYGEAKEALRVAKFTGKVGRIMHYNKIGIYRLLHKIEQAELDNFLNSVLGPLLEYDQQHSTDMVKTLDAYFTCNGNLRSLSKNLFVHYNTVLYRIERIESILGVDLSDRDTCLNLEIALKILMR